MTPTRRRQLAIHASAVAAALPHGNSLPASAILLALTLACSTGAPRARAASTPGGGVSASAATSAAAAATTPSEARSAAKAKPIASQPTPAPPAAARQAFDTAEWARLLRTYVRGSSFRYAALRANAADRKALNAFVERLALAEPKNWSRAAKLAFYINAYNALTVNSVLELWPVQSVLKEDGFFKQRKHRVADRELTLDQLENRVIRSKSFAEPRIHFAVNCASKGCPPLRSEPYVADRLERQLADQTQRFVRRTTRLDAQRRNARISQLFEWFESDFEQAGGVRTFIAANLASPDAAAVIQEPSVRITYQPYDWALNAAP